MPSAINEPSAPSRELHSVDAPTDPPLETRVDTQVDDDGRQIDSTKQSKASASRREDPSKLKLGVGLAFILAMVFFTFVLSRTGAEPGSPAVIPAESVLFPAESSADARPLEVSVVRVGNIAAPTLTRSYSGVLIAHRESEIGFERAGRIVEIMVEEGDSVSAGDVIALLDQENLDATEQRIKSELAAAEARLAELVAGPRKQTLESAKARVDELAARVRLARIDAKRQERLAPQGATSRSQLDSAVIGLEASEQSLRAAQAELAELEEGTRAEQLVAQEARCAVIRANLDEIQAQRNDSQIIAPFDSKIQSRFLDEGVVVSPGQPVLKLISNRVEARVGLPPEVADDVRIGQRVTLTASRQEIVGTVDRIAPSVTRDTRTRDVFLALHDSAGKVTARRRPNLRWTRSTVSLPMQVGWPARS